MFLYSLTSHVADVGTQSSTSKFHFIMIVMVSFVLLFPVVLHEFCFIYIFHNYNEKWVDDVL